jgi:DNA polymerase (family 10)
MMTNDEIAEIFVRVAEILAIQDEPSRRVRAYERAAESILGLEREVADIWRDGSLTDIPGIGDVLAEKIVEMLTTGQLSFYEQLQQEVPPGVVAMLRISGVGPRSAARFWNELGVTTIVDLQEAARAGRVRELSRMGARTEANLIEAIEALHRWEGRVPLGRAWYLSQAILDALCGIESVESVAVAGSVRRMCDTVHDIDLLVSTNDPAAATEHFVRLPVVAEVLLHGPVKSTVRTADGLQVDLRAIEPAQWGTALQYFTGSQAHNVHLRQLAKRAGYSLSEYGLKQVDGAKILCRTEEELYQQLGLSWIPPELREDAGEIDAALNDALPHLVSRADLRGDLQMHTTRSDGHHSLEEMVEAARAAGLQYIAITDHTESMAVAGGQTVEELRQQHAEIEALNGKIADLTILAAAEVEIRADGTLDYPDAVLAELDLVVASLHTGLRTGRERTTERMLSAIRNPHVDMIAHPTGRLIGRREGADLDIEAVLQAAAQMDTVIEINAHPDRLDLPDRYVRRAIQLGVRLAINSDAHDIQDFDHLFFGIATARRGWASAADVVNTWDFQKLKSWLAQRQNGGTV